MTRNVFNQTALVAVAAVCLGGVAINCNSTKKSARQDVGTVGLAIKLSNGVNLNKVSYKVTGNGIAPITGDIDTTGQGTTVSVLVQGIPAGMGYLIELTGTSVDGSTVCAGSATFNVEAAKTTAVNVPLQCRAAKTTGSIVVNSSLNACPGFTSIVVAPTSVDVGGTITVGATASDTDAADMLTFAWSAPSGTFAAANQANTTYACTPGGPRELTVKVSDGKCDDTFTVPVNCVPVSCGNGTVDSGEECDTSGPSATCDENCQIIAVCGDNKVEKAEQCDPPNPGFCSNTCQNVAPVCGDGFVQPAAGETCDPPAAGTCSAECKSIEPPRCGDGMVNQPTEECDTMGASATCTADCKRIKTACETCSEENCPATEAGCTALEGQDKADCEALVACMETAKCVVNGDGQPCYCGTASDANCLGGMGNGACKAQIEKAGKTTSPEEIGNRFVDPAYPLGRAANLFGCRVALCGNVCQ